MMLRQGVPYSVLLFASNGAISVHLAHLPQCLYETI